MPLHDRDGRRASGGTVCQHGSAGCLRFAAG
nr:MAG TPA_asm: hypothetical protein [Bacteriophage sp.]